MSAKEPLLPKKTGMSTGMKIGIGLAVIVVFIGLYYMFSDDTPDPNDDGGGGDGGGASGAGAGASGAGASGAGASGAGASGAGGTPAGTESTATSGSTSGSGTDTGSDAAGAAAAPASETPDQMRARICLPLNGCNNQGSCVLDGDVPSCDCNSGFTGQYCDEERCQNGGVYDEPGDSCDCLLTGGWTGDSCQIQPASCNSPRAGLYNDPNDPSQCGICTSILNKMGDSRVYLSCTGPNSSELSGSVAGQKCADDYYYVERTENPNVSGICQDKTVCGTGEYQVTAATFTSDTTCSPLTPCGPNEYISEAGGTAARPTSDNVCSAVSTCNSLQYLSQSATGTSAGVCSPLTACNSNQYQVTAPTATTNRLCDNKKAEGQPCPGNNVAGDAQCQSGDCNYENWSHCNNDPDSWWPRCQNMSCRW